MEMMKLNTAYTAIIELTKLLQKHDIPHDMIRLFDGYQIIYYKNGEYVGDVVQHYISYGHSQNLLEAYGFPECKKDVIGNMEVSEAFKLFKNAHENKN